MSTKSTHPAIPRGSRVHVTGANSFIGSHVCDQLLERGYQIRGTVHDAAKNRWLQYMFDARHGKGKFEMATVRDMQADGEWDEVLKGIARAHISIISIYSSISLLSWFRTLALASYRRNRFEL